MRTTSLLIAITVIGAMTDLVNTQGTGVGRDLKQTEMVKLWGGAIVGAWCEQASQCAPIYYQNPCDDNVNRTTAATCATYSFVPGANFICTPIDPPMPWFSCEQSTTMLICIFNYQCIWDALTSTCSEGAIISSAENVSFCIDR
jgi:hypothetical protein